MRILLALPPLLALLGAASPPQHPAGRNPQQCTVDSVNDGDSMRVRCPGQKTSQRVRLHQIDAPELDQPYGRQARDLLRKFCPEGSVATIAKYDTDQYGRMLAEVSCGSKNVNEEMVASGAAWAYKPHVINRALFTLENEARRENKGLWAGQNPQAPWEWRRKQRSR